MPSIDQKHFVLSAKRATDVGDATSGRSFTYMRNKSGPSIDPCRTPDNTGRDLELTPGTVTLWTRSVS